MQTEDGVRFTFEVRTNLDLVRSDERLLAKTCNIPAARNGCNTSEEEKSLGNGGERLVILC